MTENRLCQLKRKAERSAGGKPYPHRITLTVLITEKEIVLLDIGGHDEVYR